MRAELYARRDLAAAEPGRFYLRAVDTNDRLPAASGLIGALIGGAAAFGGQWMQLRGHERVSRDEERKLAIEEVIVRAHAIDLRVSDSITLAANVGSLAGLLGRLLGNFAPVDWLAVFDRLTSEAAGLQRAATRVSLTADPETVRLTDAVARAAAEVVEAHAAHTGNGFTHYLRIALRGRYSRDAARLSASRGALEAAQRALVQHTRGELGRSAEPGLEAPST